MNEEILKLAKECGMNTHGFPAPHWLEAFYKAAYNKAIEDATKCVDDAMCEGVGIEILRELEMK